MTFLRSSIPAVAISLCWVGLAAPARAELQLAAIFGDHMVLQRDAELKIWGTGVAGESVALAVDGKPAASGTVAGDGRWLVTLPPHPTGGAHELRVAGSPGSPGRTLHDILFGDVWLLSGQSNMDFPCDGILTRELLAEEKAKAEFPELRLFTAQHLRRTTGEVAGEWKASSSATMARFSAAGYFFGRELHHELGVPIGLINAAWSGQRSESFTSRAALEKTPAFAPLKARWVQITADYPAKFAVYQYDQLPKWQAAADKAKQQGRASPRPPAVPKGGPDDENRPGALFERHIAPLIPLTLKGIAWYQGESNADNISDAIAYRAMFPAMIQDWRARWGWDVPFLFVQLANFHAVQKVPVPRGDAWPYARESQTLALSLPHTGMSSAIDLNDDPAQIHPKDKITTGHRLAQVALAKVYARQVPHTGPIYQKMAVSGNRVRVSFDNMSGGLKPRGAAVTGFAIAGADGEFVWGEATVDGTEVVVSSPQVAAPAVVRYNWADNPIGNLYDGAGLPVLPFRSDPQTVPGLAVVPLIGHVVTLRALINGKYVTASQAANGPLINNSDLRERAERFTVIDRGYGEVALQSMANGKFAASNPNGTDAFKCHSGNLGNYETVELLALGRGSWAMLAGSNHKYLSADPLGAMPLVNDSAEAGPAQAFEISRLP
ncbi:MAG: sialate O-acetylesterase [Verrucomicrobiota bacterium]